MSRWQVRSKNIFKVLFFFFGPKIGHGNEISKYLERDKKGKKNII